MAIILIRGDEKLSLANRVWEVLLVLAAKHGWKPEGFESQRDRPNPAESARYREDWREAYFHPRGQSVAASDASAIADALETALDEIPDSASDEADDPPDDRLAQTNVIGLPVSPVELFRGEGKEVVRDMLRFCRGGGFQIE